MKPREEIVRENFGNGRNPNAQEIYGAGQDRSFVEGRPCKILPFIVLRARFVEKLRRTSADIFTPPILSGGPPDPESGPVSPPEAAPGGGDCPG